MKSESERQDDLRIMSLFRYRCVGCTSQATQVHELIPRSRTKKATTMPQNRVPLCMSCHNRSHFNGYTEDKADFLRNQAVARLIMLDVSMEEW
jgi:5-methylcytosine-specific restriction endonuclease McrA